MKTGEDDAETALEAVGTVGVVGPLIALAMIHYCTPRQVLIFCYFFVGVWQQLCRVAG